MKRYIRSSSEPANLASSAIGARVGDQIYDSSKDRFGEVVKEGQSGNYTILYVDFGDGKLVKINPIDDAQVRGRFFKVED